MDRLSVHRMITVRESLYKHKINPIFNCAGFPDGNPIECCFSQVKLRYKRERLNALVNKREFDIEDEIDRSLEAITPELVEASERRSFYMLHNTIV
jgi:transposase